MPWVKNTSSETQRGEQDTFEPGEVAEVSEKWLHSRNDRVRRGQFEVVGEPIDLSEFAKAFDEEE